MGCQLLLLSWMLAHSFWQNSRAFFFFLSKCKLNKLRTSKGINSNGCTSDRNHGNAVCLVYYKKNRPGQKNKTNLQSTNTSKANAVNPIHQWKDRFLLIAWVRLSFTGPQRFNYKKKKRKAETELPSCGRLESFLNTEYTFIKNLKLKKSVWRATICWGAPSWRSTSPSITAYSPWRVESGSDTGRKGGRQLTKPKMSPIYIRSLLHSDQILLLSAGYDLTTSLRNDRCPK